MTELVLSVGFVVAVFLIPIAVAVGVIVLLLFASSAAAPIFKRWDNQEATPDPDLFLAGLYAIPEGELDNGLRPTVSTSLAIRRAGLHPS